MGAELSGAGADYMGVVDIGFTDSSWWLGCPEDDGGGRGHFAEGKRGSPRERGGSR